MDPHTMLLAGQLTGLPKKKPCCKGRKKEPWTEGALLSEYQKEYWEKRAPHERASAHYPKSNLTPQGPFDAATTYGTTYKSPEGAGPAQPFKPQAGEKENQPFSPWTTYKVDFPAKEVPYARVRPANSLEPSAGPFVDETTMRKDYPGWGLAKPATPVRAMSVPRTAGPFEGTSMYKDDFRKWPGARPAPAAPLLGSNAALPRGAFDDATTHRTAYTPKQTGPAERFRPEDNTLKPEGWYDGVPSTEYRRHYFEKDGRPQPRAGATTGASGAVVPKGPFMGDTTYGGDFRARTAPPYQKAQRPVGEGMNSGPFYGGTTYGDSFVKKDVPYSRVRPQHAYQPNDARFDDTTEMKTNFQNWGTQPVVRAGPARHQAASAGPFDGATTYKTDYHKMQAARAAVAGRPMSGTRGLRAQGPFDGTTTYKVDYVPKPFDPSKAFHPDDCDPASDCEDEP